MGATFSASVLWARNMFSCSGWCVEAKACCWRGRGEECENMRQLGETMEMCDVLSSDIKLKLCARLTVNGWAGRIEDRPYS